jgi:hypothetical protein
MTFFSVSDAAQKIGCRPRDVSDAFYARILDESKVLRVAGRRAIPADYIPEIRRVLSERGKASQAVEG